MPEHDHIEVESPPIIVRFTDGKAGHENQTVGLVDAIERRIGGVETHTLDVTRLRSSIFGLIRFYTNPPGDFPRADLWIGAGHATHQHLRAAARYIGGYSIVCMNPGSRWARRAFDLCLIPAHDGVAEAPNVVRTRGALNAMVPSDSHDSSRGLFLIGGPSKHHGWDAEGIADQVGQVVSSVADVRWELTTSRRTPEDTLETLRAISASNLVITPVGETHRGWVGERLAMTGQCWISEDSVSMVYESLTSGAHTGVLDVARRHTGRVARGIDVLITEGQVTRFESSVLDLRAAPHAGSLWEADRCAQIVIDRFLTGDGDG
ncbi:MAG: mitochondrial fission ELM1 family protein [Phycisphaerales bacterium JB043]